MCTASLLTLLAAVGCAAPGVQLAAPVPAPARPGSEVAARAAGLAEAAPLTSARAAGITSQLWVTVRDARPERPPQSVGVARITMGIPRSIRQVGDWDLARAIGHGLGTGLQNAGWEASGFDPPDPRLALAAPGPGKSPDATLPLRLPGWTLRLTLDRLWCDGYFNEFSFTIGLRLHLLDPSGRLRARAEHREEFVREYKHPADFAFQVEEKIRQVLSSLLADLGLARGLPGADEIYLGPRLPLSRQDGGYDYRTPDRSALGEEDEDGPDCPKCGLPVETRWKHCPDCGASLPTPR